MRGHLSIATIICGLALVQCAHPMSYPQNTVTPNPEATRRCLSIYPSTPVRAVHKIDANLPFSAYASFIGVTELHPLSHQIKVVLLSVEGIVLFDAEFQGSETKINIALPPLNHEDFIQGMLGDIRFLFLPPTDSLMTAQTQADGICVCRWGAGDRLTEIQVGSTTPAQIRIIEDNNKVVKQVVLEPPLQKGLFSRMRLSIKGLGEYTLGFELLETEAAGD